MAILGKLWNGLKLLCNIWIAIFNWIFIIFLVFALLIFIF